LGNKISCTFGTPRPFSITIFFRNWPDRYECMLCWFNWHLW